MKKFLLATTVALMALTGASQANAMTPKTVNYSCNNGKSINVKYYFNDSGLPTKAVTNLGGRNLTLAYNQTYSNNANTMFGSSKGYNFGTEYMDDTNYNQLDIGPIMNAKSQILYKLCSPTNPR